MARLDRIHRQAQLGLQRAGYRALRQRGVDLAQHQPHEGSALTRALFQLQVEVAGTFDMEAVLEPAEVPEPLGVVDPRVLVHRPHMGRVLPGGGRVLVRHFNAELAVRLQQPQAVAHQRRQVGHVFEHVVGVDDVDAALFQAHRPGVGGLRLVRQNERRRQVEQQVRLGAGQHVEVQPAALVVLAGTEVDALRQPGLRGPTLVVSRRERRTEGQQVGIGLDRVGMLEALKRFACHGKELGRAEVLREKLFELLAFEPEHAVFEGRVRQRLRRAFGNHRRAERQAMRDARLLEAAALVEVRVDHRLRLQDELVALGAVERAVEHGHRQPGGLDAVEPGAAPLVHAADEQQVDRAIFEWDGLGGCEVGRMQQWHHRHVVDAGGVGGAVVGVVVDHGRAGEQLQVVGRDLRPALAQLFQVDEDAGMALALRGVEAEVRTEHEVQRVVPQAVLRQADSRAQALGLVAKVACLVEQAE